MGALNVLGASQSGASFAHILPTMLLPPACALPQRADQEGGRPARGAARPYLAQGADEPHVALNPPTKPSQLGPTLMPCLIHDGRRAGWSGGGAAALRQETPVACRLTFLCWR